eukprot:6211191-Pleurochrysis_carterae.AAC.1
MSPRMSLSPTRRGCSWSMPLSDHGQANTLTRMAPCRSTPLERCSMSSFTTETNRCICFCSKEALCKGLHSSAIATCCTVVCRQADACDADTSIAKRSKFRSAALAFTTM